MITAQRKMESDLLRYQQEQGQNYEGKEASAAAKVILGIPGINNFQDYIGEAAAAELSYQKSTNQGSWKEMFDKRNLARPQQQQQQRNDQGQQYQQQNNNNEQPRQRSDSNDQGQRYQQQQQPRQRSSGHGGYSID